MKIILWNGQKVANFDLTTALRDKTHEGLIFEFSKNCVLKIKHMFHSINILELMNFLINFQKDQVAGLKMGGTRVSADLNFI